MISYMSERIWHGMNWIRQEKRLAIYMRDGMACAWCGRAVEQETILTLDHLKPFSRGGSNSETNLVTACKQCNSARGARPVRTFARVVAEYPSTDAKTIETRVRSCARRKLNIAAAKALIAVR